MTWWAWLLLAGYIVGYALTFRRISGQTAWHMAANSTYGYEPRPRKFPSGEQWFGAITSGVVLALVWPLSLPTAYSIAASRSARGLLYTPPAARERIQRERIAQLEREAGIR